MANTVTVLEQIHGSYITFYDRAADQPGVNYWIDLLHIFDPSITRANAGTVDISKADQEYLGQQFVMTQASYFHTAYANPDNVTFISELYKNLGGTTNTDASDQVAIESWAAQVTALTVTVTAQNAAHTVPNVPNGVLPAGITAQDYARATIAADIVHDFQAVQLTNATDLGMTQAQFDHVKARQDTFFNKIAVSAGYANASNTTSGAFLTVTAVPSEAFTASQEIIDGVTNNPTTTADAQTAIFAAVAAGNFNPIHDLAAANHTSATLTTAPNDNPHDVTDVFGSFTTFLFDGVGPTLNGNDHIKNVTNLNLSDGFGTGIDIIPAGVTIENVQNVKLDTNGNAGLFGTQSFNTANIAGVQTLTVNSNGAGVDFLNASQTTNITENQNNPGPIAGAIITGGKNVTATSLGGGGVMIGTTPAVIGGPVDPTMLPTGAVVVNEKSSTTGSVFVVGATDVTVNVTSKANTGTVQIGNTIINTGDDLGSPNANPTGKINVTSASVAGGQIVAFGGTDVNITAAGSTAMGAGTGFDPYLGGNAHIVVGDPDATGTGAPLVGNQPSGNVTVVDKQAVTYDNLIGAGHNIINGGGTVVIGGKNVNVTTNTGDFSVIGWDSNEPGTLASGTITLTNTASDRDGAFGVGAYAGGINGNSTIGTGDLIAGGTGVTVNEMGGGVTIGSTYFQKGPGTPQNKGQNPTGTVSVTENLASHTFVTIDGGNGVTVNAKGQLVTIGTDTGTAGDQVINQKDVLTGKGLGGGNFFSQVTDFGGANVTVNTSGGNVFIGGTAADGVLYAPTGVVNVNNTFSGANSANNSSVVVLGGTTVNVTEKNTTNGAITIGPIGPLQALDPTGTTLLNPNAYATGDVVINNSVTNGGVTTYGKALTGVWTNGGKTVTVNGGGATFVADAQTTLATGGPGIGKAIGTSTLSTVNATGIQGVLNVKTDVSTVNVSMTGGGLAATGTAPGNLITPTALTVKDVNAHTLNLTISNNQKSTVTDATATTVVVTDGAAGNVLNAVTLAKATSVTFNNAKTLTTALTAASATSVTFNSGAATTLTGPATFGTNAAIVATGAGLLTLGNLSTGLAGGSVASVDSSGQTAGGTVVRINSDTTTFKGGAGNDTVTVDVTVGLNGDATRVTGGGGTNTVILTNKADLYNPILFPDAAIINDFTGFTQLGLAAGTGGGNKYDVSGFTNINISDATGAQTRTLSKGTGSLTISADNAGGTTIWDSTAMAAPGITVGIDGKTGTAGIDAGTVVTGTAAAGMGSVTVNSVGTVKGLNLLTLADTKGAHTSLTVNGDEAIQITDAASNYATVTVNNTGATNVAGAVMAKTGATVTGSAGAGFITVNLFTGATASNKAVDKVTTGAGGGTITIGAGNDIVAGVTLGSETINLGASTAARDTLISKTAPSAAAEGTRAIVNGFTNAPNLVSDQLTFEAAKTIVKNTAVGAPITGTSGAKYVSSNGVISLITGAPTAQAELQDVAEIVAGDVGTIGGADAIAEVVIAGATFVIASNTTGTIATDPAKATILQLNGVNNVTGFSFSKSTGINQGSGTTVALTNGNFANVAADNGGSTIANKAWDDTGFTIDTLKVGKAGVTNTYNNLGGWAEIKIGGAVAAGNLTTNQLGPSGTNELLILGNTATLDTVTVNGTKTVTIDNNPAGLFTIKNLVDGTNTMTTLYLTGIFADPIDVKAITSTSLTLIDATKVNNPLNGGSGSGSSPVTIGDGTALTQTGLTILGPLTEALTVSANGATNTITALGSGGFAVANVITANGAGDIITSGNATNNSHGSVIIANGAGDTINLFDGGFTDTVTANGAGTVLIENGTGLDVFHMSGKGDTITFFAAPAAGSTLDGGSLSTGIGNDSTVNLSSGAGGNGVQISVTGDVWGAANSSGAGHFITLAGAISATTGLPALITTGTGNSLWFNNQGVEVTAGGTFGTSQVNVESATTLAQALDIAASYAALSQQPAIGAGTVAGLIPAHTGVLDWFQFGGNTYIVETINGGAANALHTALQTGDQVIKITGLVDLSGSTFDGTHTVTL